MMLGAGLKCDCGAAGGRFMLDPLKELQSISVEQCIALVENDIASGRDRYRKIPPHELALVLGIGDSRHPGRDWSFTQFVERVSVEEYAKRWVPPSELLYRLENKVEKKRFVELIAKSDDLDSSDGPSFSFLSVDERAIIENAMAEKELQGASDNGTNCIGHRSVATPSGQELRFEGDMEEDGTCITLLTPYDFRDGRFCDLSRSLTNSW